VQSDLVRATYVINVDFVLLMKNVLMLQKSSQLRFLRTSTYLYRFCKLYLLSFNEHFAIGHYFVRDCLSTSWFTLFFTFWPICVLH